MQSYQYYVDNHPYWIILCIVIIFTFLTIVFYYTRDKYEPEPISRIVVAFIYGIISVIPAIVISVLVSSLIPSNTVLFSILIAPVIEEFCKGYFVVLLSKDNTFDGPLDGFVYGAMVGSGFAAVENILYGISAVLQYTNNSGVELTFIRSMTLIIGHPFYTGIMGAGVGAYKVGLQRSPYNEIWVSMMFHAFWNGVASLSTTGTFFLGLLVVIIASIYKMRVELRKAIALDKVAFEQGYYTKKKEYYEQLERMRQESMWGHYPPFMNNEDKPF